MPTGRSAATPQPAATQELVVGAPDDQFQIEYQPLKARLGNSPISINICETLVRLGEDFSLQPLLATSWDPNTRQPALQSGESDLVMDLPREQVATIKSHAGLKVANAPAGRTMLMYLG